MHPAAPWNNTHERGVADFRKGMGWLDLDVWLVPLIYMRPNLERLFRTRLTSSTCECGGIAITHLKCSQGKKGFLWLSMDAGLTPGSLLQDWDHGDLNLKKAVLKGGEGDKKPNKQHAQTPTTFQCWHLEINLPHSHPSPIAKIKTKINHKGKGRKNLPSFMCVSALLQQLLYLAFTCFCGVS